MRSSLCVLCALAFCTAARAQPAPPPSTPPAPAAPSTTPPAPAAPSTTPAAPAPPAAPTTSTATAPAGAVQPVKATDAVTDGRVKVIVLDLKAASLSPAEASAITSLVTVALSEYTAFEVVSGADVREMMALEGEKAQLGCEESMSCIAEIAGALGARMVAFGQIEKLGTRFIMSVNLQDTKEGRSAGRIALQGDSLDAIAAAVPDAVHKVAEQFLVSEHLPTTTTSARVEAPKLTAPPAAPPKSDLAWLSWTGGAVAIAGAAVLATGTIILINIASSSGAPGEVVQAAQVPVAGPFLAAASSGGSCNAPTATSGGSAQTKALVSGASNCAADATTVAVLYTVGGVEALVAAAAGAGALGWSVAQVADGPKLGTAGNAWRFGLLGGGAALVVGGALYDATAASSKDHKLDALDFIGPAAEVVGVTAAIVGLSANPFPEETP